ncbi:Hypothetical predicted protein [Podarcis lilfordi]|uniref:Secreted protein n=1 Tax=Podarcis lilfordi TaxID=74358 RepID=A0AA35JU31_9SAUR|nr:Hypothetical predicted protein [Podarcis lilfordi]
MNLWLPLLLAGSAFVLVGAGSEKQKRRAFGYFQYMPTSHLCGILASKVYEHRRIERPWFLVSLEAAREASTLLQLNMTVGNAVTGEECLLMTRLTRRPRRFAV